MHVIRVYKSIRIKNKISIVTIYYDVYEVYSVNYYEIKFIEYLISNKCNMML
jgi:hypothetical protein